VKRSERATAWRIFRWPALLAAATITGLISGLLGDWLADLLAWVTLGGLIGVILVAYVKSE
jgi:hypothetical protein